MLMLKRVVIPVLMWILPSQSEHLCGSEAAKAFYSFLSHGLINLSYVSLQYALLIV